jgi:hypothetical protein
VLCAGLGGVRAEGFAEETEYMSRRTIK